jgi:hypothetical protein
MTYDVIWDPPTERDLTQLWLASRMRHAIRDAVDRIDAALQWDPHNCGESRDAGRRVMHEAPVGVLFTIDEDRRQVRVEAVWQY